MSWCPFKTAFILTDDYPNLDKGVVEEWIWDELNASLPTGWELTETDSAGARSVLVFEIDHPPTQDEVNAVQRILEIMEKNHAT